MVHPIGFYLRPLHEKRRGALIKHTVSRDEGDAYLIRCETCGAEMTETGGNKPLCSCGLRWKVVSRILIESEPALNPLECY